MTEAEKLSIVSNYTVSFDLMKRDIGEAWPEKWRCRCISCKSGGFSHIAFGSSIDEALDKMILAHKQWNDL